MKQTETTSLQGALNKKKSDWQIAASDEKKKAYEDGFKAMEASGVLKKAKQTGEPAPDFELTNATGARVTLSDYLKKGNVILIWYRGGWCPYCNLTLRYFQNHLADFKKTGANLLALTSELPDNSLETSEKNELQFEVLSDIGNGVARKYGVVYKLTEEVAEFYRQSFDLHDFNGDNSNELPLAATYIIDRSGMIRYAFLETDFRKRAEPSEVLEVLRTI